MIRLTERDEFGNAEIIGVDSDDLLLNIDFDEFNMVTGALDSLAAYEETELMPEEIIKLNDFINSQCAKLLAENTRLKAEQDVIKGQLFINERGDIIDVGTI